MTDSSVDREWNTLYYGIRKRPQLVGAGFLLVLVSGLLFVEFVPRLLSDENHRFALWMFNGFTGVVLFATLLAFPFATLYGLWNGGPVLAAGLAVVPVMTGQLLAGQLTATVDVTLAVAAAGCAAIVATLRTWHWSVDRDVDSPSPAVVSGAVSVGFGLSVTAAIVSTTLLWRLLQTAGPHVFAWVWAAGGFLLLTLCGLLIFAVLAVAPNRGMAIGQR